MPTPFELVAAVQTPQRGYKWELVAASRAMERAALLDPPRAVAATLQDARFLTPHTRAVYTDLAAARTSATLFARDLQSWIAPGVAGVALDDDDPLVDEWVVVLPSPSAPTVFAATDLDEACDQDRDRCFLYAVSRDPEVVSACLGLLSLADR